MHILVKKPLIACARPSRVSNRTRKRCRIPIEDNFAPIISPQLYTVEHIGFAAQPLFIPFWRMPAGTSESSMCVSSTCTCTCLLHPAPRNRLFCWSVVIMMVFLRARGGNPGWNNYNQSQSLLFITATSSEINTLGGTLDLSHPILLCLISPPPSPPLSLLSTFCLELYTASERYEAWPTARVDPRVR